MNCCDHNCHQGRDCPIRNYPLPVSFAEPEPKPTPTWALGDIIAMAVFALAMLVIGFSLGRLMV